MQVLDFTFSGHVVGWKRDHLLNSVEIPIDVLNQRILLNFTRQTI